MRAWAEGAEPKGEIVVVVAGAARREAPIASLVGEVLARVGAGERLKDAVRDVAETAGVSARELYAEALAAKSPS